MYSIVLHVYTFMYKFILMFILVGNAAFHSAALYGHLDLCLPALINALLDKDEKTRANAAGAIGNLVRNSGQLSSRMASLGIVNKLMNIFISDQDITTQRIALFSLGTMAIYADTRSVVLVLLQLLILMSYCCF